MSPGDAGDSTPGAPIHAGTFPEVECRVSSNFLGGFNHGNEIRQARERAGLTQGYLVSGLGGVSGRTVGNWGETSRSRATSWPKWSRVLNVREYLGSESKLQDVSDASLLAEIARRFDEGQLERRAGGGNADSSPSINQAEGNSAVTCTNCTRLRSAPAAGRW